MVESLVWVTRLAAKAKTVVAKVKQVVAPMVGTSEDGEARPFTT